MASPIPESSWSRAVLGRAVVLGLALGTVSMSGGTLVIAETGTSALNVSVVVATVLVAFGAGVWAGAPEMNREELRLRERWWSAAALAAVGASFAAFWSLYQQIYPGPWWRVAGLVLVLAAPIYALGLVLPVLGEWAERYLAERNDEPAEWGSLGALLAGILGGATAGVLAAGFLTRADVSAGYLLIAAALTLLLSLLLPDPAAPFPRERVLIETVSPFGTLRVTEVAYPGERQPERRLYLNDEEESGELLRSGAPTLAYVAAAENLITSITPPEKGYLFLGGGAHTLPRRIAERDPRARLTVVELDPEVTRLAYRFFGVNRHHRITTMHGDARAFLEMAGGEIFDRIFLDVYAGREALPYSLVTREAAEAIDRRLSADGVAVMNVIGIVTGAEAQQLWSVVRTYCDLFAHVAVYSHLGQDFPERQNILLAVGHDAAPPFPLTAGTFELWPRAEWPEPSGVVVFRDVQPGAVASASATRVESA